jgi:signal transduction histidine kinase
MQNVRDEGMGRARGTAVVANVQSPSFTDVATSEVFLAGPVPAASSSSLEHELLGQAQADNRATALERRLRRLAFDLHDGALQELAALGAELASIRRQVVPLTEAETRDRVEGRFDDLQARLVGIDGTLRGLLLTIDGSGAPLEALDTKIAREVAALRDETGIEAELEITGSFADLTESRRIVIFQIVREALANIRAHSDAEHVRVRVIEREGTVEVSVEDDGRGFDRDTALLDASVLRRLGLTGMLERVRMLGSELEIETEPGVGTTVSFVLDAWHPSDATVGMPSELIP